MVFKPMMNDDALLWDDPLAPKPNPRDACLVVIYGCQEGKWFLLKEGTISLGRSPESDIQIQDPGTSRRHAQIINDGIAVLWRDLESAQGSYVNGKRIKEQVLHHGDEIWTGLTGWTMLKFISAGKVVSSYYTDWAWRSSRERAERRVNSETMRPTGR